jgi:uncharacterized protein (TIGR00297 family)
LYRSRPERWEDWRQVEHLLPIAFAFLLPYIGLITALLLCAAAVVHALFLSPRWIRVTTRRQEAARGYSPGKLSYALCVAALLIVFRDHEWRAAAVWAMLAFGDSFSNVIGRRWGRRRLPFNPNKSWTGLVSCWLFAGLGAFLVYAWNRPADPSWTLADAWFVCLAAALPAALAEALPVPVDDNIMICWAGAVSIALLDQWPNLVWSVDPGWYIVLGLNGAMAVIALGAGWLNWCGGAVAALVGTASGLGFGWEGFLVLCVFLAAGSLSTRAGAWHKRKLGVEEGGRGRRGAVNVISKGLVPALIALAATWFSDRTLLAAAFSGALAAGAFDTVATEIGQWLGGRPVDPRTGKVVPVGTPGAVSWEGTAAGLGAAAVLGGLTWLVGWFPASGIVVVTLAGAVGGVGESMLAAGAPRNLRFQHEAMNILTTLLGATAGGLLWLL